jgi:hypothetical protein
MGKIFLTIFVFGVSAAAQPFGVGVKVGVPLNDALSAKPGGVLSYVENTNRWLAGPFVEVRLPGRFAVELDALYRSYDFHQVLTGPSLRPIEAPVSAGAWEFPLLAKKSLLGGPIQPYVEGGVALSHLSVNDVVELNHRNNYGIVLGAGVSLHLGPLRIAPELRYSGWTFRNFDSPGGLLQSNRNQASVLVGIDF